MLTLTPAQIKVVQGIDTSIAVIAGAGSGKTRVLVERYQQILARGDCGLANIATITFTERAAEEIAERLRRVLSPEHTRALDHAPITTFHGLCGRILRAHAPRLSLRPDFDILDAHTATTLLEASVQSTMYRALELDASAMAPLLTQWRYAQLVEHVSHCVADRWNWERAVNAPSPDLPPHSSTREKDFLEICTQLIRDSIATYDARKRAQHVVDFHDLEILALELLTNTPEILSDYQRQFRHLLIDEFQDTNPIQLELVRALFTPPDNILCIVGDPKQSIYGFRGAMTACFATMCDTIVRSNGELVILAENFRSRPEILTFVNHLCAHIPAAEQLQPYREPGALHGGVARVVYDSENCNAEQSRVAQGNAVATHIAYLIATTDMRYGDIACLLPTHLSAPPLEAALRAKNIPFINHAPQGLFSTPAVTDLTRLLEWIVSYLNRTPDDGLLFAVLRSPLFGYTWDDCYALRFSSHDTTNTAEQKSPTPLHDAALHDAQLGPVFREWIALAAHTTLDEWLRAICVQCGFADVWEALDPTHATLIALQQLFAVAEQCVRDSLPDVPTAGALLLDIARGKNDIGVPAAALTEHGAVHLLTVHGSKGNEFPVVYLLDLDSERPTKTPALVHTPELGFAVRTIPDTDDLPSDDLPRWCAIRDHEKNARAAEGERLRYVAVTRARELLVAVLPIAPKEKHASAQFHATCDALHIAPTSMDAINIPCNATVTASHVIAETPTIRVPTTTYARVPHEITVSALESFARCPHEYALKYHYRFPAYRTDANVATLDEAARGELVHALIAAQIAHPQGDLNAQLRACAARLHMTLTTAAHDDICALTQTACSALPALDHAQSELPFVWSLEIPISPDRTAPANTRTTMIRGTIDLLYRDAHGLHLVDFKTDRIENAQHAEQKLAQYELQLSIYTLAAERMYTEPVASAKLLFVHGPTWIELPRASITSQRTSTRVQNVITQIAAEHFAIPNTHTPPCAACVFLRHGICGGAASLTKCP